MSGADFALARALVAGDEYAFELLIEQETSHVFRACYRVLGRIEEAEDATQEAFVLAYRALGTYRGKGPAAAWLMRIATREAWRRSTAGRKRASMSGPLDDAILAAPSESPGLETEAIEAEQRAGVRLAVQRLNEPYREVITLRYFGELSLKEIAAATDRPVGTIKAQVHRGQRHLREILSREILSGEGV